MSRYGKKVQIPAYLIGAVIMVVGYFLAKWYLKSSVEMALAGIPENIFQSGVGAVIAFICYPIVKKLKTNKKANCGLFHLPFFNNTLDKSYKIFFCFISSFNNLSMA